MEVTSDQAEGVTLVRIAGRIDHDHADALDKALSPFIEGTDGGLGLPLLLDMAGVDFLTSAGLRVLMIMAKACDRQGRPVAVANLRPAIAEIIRISRFDLVIPVYETVADALDSLSEKGA